MGGANQRYKTPQDGGWGVRNPWPVQVQTNGMPGQGESGAEALPRLWGSTSGRRCGGRRQPLEPSHRTTVWEGPMILNFTPPGGGGRGLDCGIVPLVKAPQKNLIKELVPLEKTGGGVGPQEGSNSQPSNPTHFILSSGLLS